MMRVIDELDRIGVAVISISGGGEPMLRDDFDRIIDYASSKGLYAERTPNGTMPRAKYERLLASGVDEIGISLDGVNGHDLPFSHVGPPILSMLRYLNDNLPPGKKLTINVTVSQANRGKVQEIVDYCGQHFPRARVWLNPVVVGEGALRTSAPVRTDPAYLRECTGGTVLSAGFYIAGAEQQYRQEKFTGLLGGRPVLRCETERRLLAVPGSAEPCAAQRFGARLRGKRASGWTSTPAATAPAAYTRATTWRSGAFSPATGQTSGCCGGRRTPSPAVRSAGSAIGTAGLRDCARFSCRAWRRASPCLSSSRSLSRRIVRRRAGSRTPAGRGHRPHGGFLAADNGRPWATGPGVRTYTAANSRLGVSAKVKVRSDFAAPGRKTWTILERTGSGLIADRVIQPILEAECDSAGTRLYADIDRTYYRFES